MWPPAFRVLAGDVLHHALHEADVLRHPRDQTVFGGVAAAGAVAVEMRETILRKIETKFVGVPRAASKASGRMTGPPRDTNAALELVAVRPQHARDLEHAGVAGGVVTDADIPRVVMAVQQHELFRLGLAADFHDR